MFNFKLFRINTMNRPFRFLATVVTLVLLSSLNPQLASANTILTYTGNPFTSFASTYDVNPYTSAMFVSASLEIDVDLRPNGRYDGYAINWTINDGVQTISRDFPNIHHSDFFGNNFLDVHFSTDASSSIVAWSFNDLAQYGPHSYEYGFISSVGGCATSNCIDGDQGSQKTNFGNYSGIVEGNHGTWTSSVAAIPEPGTYAMLLAGLSLLGFVARRRK